MLVMIKALMMDTNMSTDSLYTRCFSEKVAPVSKKAEMANIFNRDITSTSWRIKREMYGRTLLCLKTLLIMLKVYKHLLCQTMSAGQDCKVNDKLYVYEIIETADSDENNAKRIGQILASISTCSILSVMPESVRHSTCGILSVTPGSVSHSTCGILTQTEQTLYLLCVDSFLSKSIPVLYDIQSCVCDVCNALFGPTSSNRWHTITSTRGRTRDTPSRGRTRDTPSRGHTRDIVSTDCDQNMDVCTCVCYDTVITVGLALSGRCSCETYTQTVNDTLLYYISIVNICKHIIVHNVYTGRVISIYFATRMDR